MSEIKNRVKTIIVVGCLVVLVIASIVPIFFEAEKENKIRPNEVPMQAEIGEPSNSNYTHWWTSKIGLTNHYYSPIEGKNDHIYVPVWDAQNNISVTEMSKEGRIKNNHFFNISEINNTESIQTFQPVTETEDHPPWLYILSSNTLYSVKLNCSLNWKINLPENAGNGVVEIGDNIYTGSADGEVFKFDKEGNLIEKMNITSDSVNVWKKFDGGLLLKSSSTSNQSIISIDFNGDIRWTSQTKPDESFREMKVGGERIYISSTVQYTDSYLKCLNSDGNEIWSKRISQGFPWSLLVKDNIYLSYVNTTDSSSHIVNFNRTGDKKWEYSQPDPRLKPSRLQVKDERVFVGYWGTSNQGNITKEYEQFLCIDSDGDVIEEITFDEVIESRPYVDERGIIYLVTRSGRGQSFVMDEEKPQAIGEYKKDNDLVKFTASNSSDDIKIVNYTWSFKYSGGRKKLYGEIVNFTFEEPGTYEIKLAVEDVGGNNDTDTIQFTIEKEDDSNGGDTPGFTFLLVLISVFVAVIYRRRREKAG